MVVVSYLVEEVVPCQVEASFLVVAFSYLEEVPSLEVASCQEVVVIS